MPPVRRHLLTILLLTLLAATPAQAQTVKAISFNTTNNIVLGATNSDPLVFTNSLAVPYTVSAPVSFSAHILKATASIIDETGAGGALEIDSSQGTIYTARLTAPATLSTNGVDLVLPNQSGTLALASTITTNIAVLVAGGGTNTLQFSNGVLTNVTTP
jgi:hypothetical protein